MIEASLLTLAALPGVPVLTWAQSAPPAAEAFDGGPSWSPDGEQIAFQSKRDSGKPEIYVMRADSSHQVRLTRR